MPSTPKLVQLPSFQCPSLRLPVLELLVEIREVVLPSLLTALGDLPDALIAQDMSFLRRSKVENIFISDFTVLCRVWGG